MPTTAKRRTREARQVALNSIIARVLRLEREVDLLSITDRLRTLSRRVAKLEEVPHKS